MASTRDEIVGRIRADHATWRTLVAEIGPARLDAPGAMGDWSFKDLASHLSRWRSRTIDRLESAAQGRPRPPNPWPAEVEDDDLINAWFRDQDAPRSGDELLAEYDASFDRVARAVEALPTEAFLRESSESPGYFRWTDATGELESDFSGHLRSHVDDVRAWLRAGDSGDPA